MHFFGTIQRGLGKGRELGFPTLNFDISVAPKELQHGIYAVRTTIGGIKYSGVMHYGPRPAVKAGVSLEVHLFDLAKDIYGQEVDVEIVGKRIREVKNFENTVELSEAIKRDVAQAKRILK